MNIYVATVNHVRYFAVCARDFWLLSARDMRLDSDAMA
jgi:hypothetical protein